MDIEQKFTFVPLAEKNYPPTHDKRTRHLFEKWGLNIRVQEYLFNEPFHQYQKYQLAEAFFKDDNVAKTLKVYDARSWLPRGIVASSVTMKQTPCSVLNMAFFDRLKNPENNIIQEGGSIVKRCDVNVDGIWVSDNLRGMLIDEESSEHLLYRDAEREEFIFRLFKMLVLGGELCQYEDELQPYLDCTKNLYKDLIRVRKPENSENLTVGTSVIEVVAKDNQDVSYYPFESHRIQNEAFLLVDSDLRRIKTIAHQYSG